MTRTFDLKEGFVANDRFIKAQAQKLINVIVIVNGMMKKYEISIEGISPIIWNRMKKELIDEQKKCKKDQLSDWEENNWKRKSEFDNNNNVLIPNEWIKMCLIESAKKTRIVPNFATSKNQTYTFYMQSSMVEVLDSVCKMKDLEYYGAFVGARGKNSPTKTWRVRPLFKNWKTRFLFTDPDGRMDIKELKEILDFSGLMIGIGDNRINNFGRFEIKKVKECSNVGKK